jgi:uncharacterized membrane protein YdjX (TVP38/TMEM64 family)
VLTLVVVAGALFVVLGGWDFVRDGDRVEAFFTERGAVGPLVFVLAMFVLQPAGVPGLVFMVPAAVVWPLPTAIVLSWIGNMGASTIAFAMARHLARDWVQDHMPTRLQGWDRRLATGGLLQVVLLRVVTGQFTPADWLLGVSTVGVGRFLVGTGIGIVPGIVLATTVGGGLVDLLTHRWIRLPALVLVVGVLVLRRARRARGSVRRTA